MKKNKLMLSIFFVCISTVFINMSCKKEEPARVIEFFTMKVNNAPAGAKSISTKIKKSLDDKNYLQITATLGNNDLVFVDIFYNEIGERCILKVSSDDKGDFGYRTLSTNRWYEASRNYGSGQIIIIKNDLNGRTIQGTFAGTVEEVDRSLDQKDIAEGSFAVNY
ncbi:MAG: hypothetical protein ABI707_07980 [Ferruginibacter sp.]